MSFLSSRRAAGVCGQGSALARNMAVSLGAAPRQVTSTPYPTIRAGYIIFQPLLGQETIAAVVYWEPTVIENVAI